MNGLDSAIDAEEAALAAHHAIRQARMAVDELHTALRSTLAVLEDVDLDLARATVRDNPDAFRGIAIDHVDSLQRRCAQLPVLADDVDRLLAFAAQRVDEAVDLSYHASERAPDQSSVVMQMRPGLAALSEAVELARPAAHAAAARAAAARYASSQITEQTLIERDPSDVSLRHTWTEVSRADQSVELLDRTVDRASEMSRAGVEFAEPLSAAARREEAHRTHVPPSPQPSGPAR